MPLMMPEWGPHLSSLLRQLFPWVFFLKMALLYERWNPQLQAGHPARRCTGNPSAPTQQRDTQGIPQLPPWWMMWNPNSSRAQEQHQSMAEMRPRSPCNRSSQTSDHPAGSVSTPPAPRPVKPVDSSHPSGVHQIFSTSWTPCSPPHSPSCALPSQPWLAGVTGAQPGRSRPHQGQGLAGSQ